MINITLIEPRLVEIEASVAAIRAAAVKGAPTICIQREAANMTISTAAITDWADTRESWLHGTEIIGRGKLLCDQLELLFPTGRTTS